MFKTTAPVTLSYVPEAICSTAEPSRGVLSHARITQRVVNDLYVICVRADHDLANTAVDVKCLHPVRVEPVVGAIQPIAHTENRTTIIARDVVVEDASADMRDELRSVV